MRRSEAIEKFVRFMLDMHFEKVPPMQAGATVFDFLEKEIGMLPPEDKKRADDYGWSSVNFHEWEPEDESR